jgi:hypothetical protein
MLGLENVFSSDMKKCNICGSEKSLDLFPRDNASSAGGKPSPNSPSLDRIDNSKGYIEGNVIVVSWRANNLKRDASIQELQKIVEFYQRLISNGLR